MSRHVYFKNKNKKWNKHQHIDDRTEGGGGDHIRIVNQGFNRRDQRPGGRRSFEAIRRAVEMNILPGGPEKSSNASNTGLGIGEAWARVTVVNGASCSLSVILELINMACGTQLRFYNTMIEAQNVVTYAKIRQKQLPTYRRAIERLHDPTTNKVFTVDLILVSEPRIPSTVAHSANPGSQSLPDDWVEALKRCFVTRYQTTTRTLDLSNLHSDPTLLSQGLFLPLNRTFVVHTLIRILRENSLQLSSLSLANNRLTHLNAFSPLAATANDSSPVLIERIDLSGNPLNGFQSLAGLRGIAGLTELDISETPLATRFNQKDKVLAANIAKVLPHLKRLNGTDIPQTVQFAIEQRSKQTSVRVPLPESRLGFFPNDEIRVPLLCFLKDYFARYDTNPRGENMLSYYTSTSQLVISVTQDNRSMSTIPGFANARVDIINAAGDKETALLTVGRFWQLHIQKSRNLLAVRNMARRRDLVAHGSVACASLLGELPPTEHPLESLSVDVIFHSDSQIVFTVAGVFYEIAPRTDSKKIVRKTLRCFSRTMILVAPGGQILQDDLVIANPSSFLVRKYVTSMASKSQPIQATPTQQPANVPSVSSSSPQLPDPNTQAVLVNQLRQLSGMNEAFSRRCLEEYEWNAEAALNAFQALRAAGRLPPEAF